MKKKVFDFIKKNSMICRGDKILIALSGGPDSVCLLHILHNLKNELKINLYAAHINHCLRGDEALKDEEYSKNLCDRFKIPFYSKTINVHKISKDKGISIEMAGRDVRYEFFNEIKKDIGIDKIAIAHNSNDQAETLIMRVMRGTGIEGLVGIKPIRDGIYIRPILCLTRREIESYCKEEQLEPRIDASNLEEIYSRNKIRLNIIPYMEKNFNRDTISALNRLAYNCSKDVEFIEYMVNEKYNKYCTENLDSIIIYREAFEEMEAIITRIIKKSLMTVSDVRNNFEMKHIYDIVVLQKSESGKKINITNSVIAINEYGNIKLKLNKHLNKNEEELFCDLNKIFHHSKHIIIESNQFGKFILEEKDNNEKFIVDDFTKYFSMDNISKLTIRGRKDGDKIIPLGMKGSKKIKNIFIDCKVPKDLRNSVPIIVFDNEVGWVVGLRVSDNYKITKDTKKLLKITFIRKEQ